MIFWKRKVEGRSWNKDVITSRGVENYRRLDSIVLIIKEVYSYCWVCCYLKMSERD